MQLKGQAGAVLLVAALALLLVMVAPAAGHGMMIQPRSRNWVAYLEQNYPWAHGLNMGGVDAASDTGKLTYPKGRRNYCGDAYNETKWDEAGPVQVTYPTGGVVNVDVMVTTNHMGRFSIQVCPLDAKPGQGKCKNLYLKAPGHTNTKSWYFPGIDHWGGGNSGLDGPRYGDDTFSAYKLPSILDKSGWGCTAQGVCNQFIGNWVYRTQWLLPPNFTCEHCKLQWYWTTGHRCWPPCEPGNPFPQCPNRQMFGTCGTPGTAYPEEFINCADIRVGDNAKIDPATNYPPWNNAAEIKGGRWGAIRPSLIHEKDK